MQKLKFKAAIFDLDGTLACTLPDLEACVNRMLAAVGYPLQSREDVLKHVNYGERDYIRFSLPTNAADNDIILDNCIKIYTKIYGEHYCDNTYVYDGVMNSVIELKKNGVWLAVHTNKKHEHACGMLEKLGLMEYFDYVLGDGIYPSKPDPHGSYAIAEKAGLTPADFCFIGDSNVDIETALNAGMYPIGVTWGYRDEGVLLKSGAKKIVNNASELLDFIIKAE